MHYQWRSRAAAAEDAVLTRHARRLWLLPRTRLGRAGWPPNIAECTFLTWNYWWQAHFLDCLLDAQTRQPADERRARIEQVVRAVRIRNITGWPNRYYDDMAWMGLALERALCEQGIEHVDALRALESELLTGWDPDVGALPWRKGDVYYNTPANGPAAILFARLGRIERARELADWIDERLRDPVTGLVFDGLRGGRVDRSVYTYCQGVVLGVETELAMRADSLAHHRRVQRLVPEVAAHLCRDGVIGACGGGDGGLFAGILARYLAFVATQLPELGDADADARDMARDIVLRSAESAWANRLQVEGRPLFGHDWRLPAGLPGVPGQQVPERDLSVQLSGWMLMEAACVAAGA